MSAEIASLEKVRTAASQIRAAGGVATADKVIANLGGGSKSTVLKHLKMLRDGPIPDEAIPQSVLELARPAITEIFAAGEKSGSDRSAAGLVRLTSSIAELEAQIDELAGENSLLQQRVEEMELERSQLDEKIATLEAALSKAGDELQDARGKLVDEHAAHADKLADLMKRIDEGVAFMTRNRPTLRLPKDRDHT